MCLLIVMRGLDSDYPILVAGNRDELRARPSAPPGLWVGERHRVLSPRDREAGGTWMGVSDLGLFAGLTNVSAGPVEPGATSRGELPHLALDCGGLDEAVAAVLARVESEAFNGFQLALCDGRRTAVIEHAAGSTTVHEAGTVAVITNEHRLGEFAPSALEPVTAAGLTEEQRFDAVLPILRDEGELTGHQVLKKGELYGTVSSAWIAVAPTDPRALVWRFASGMPDEARYRSYGNLGRRLVEE